MRICGCNDKGRHKGICTMSINNNPLPVTQGVNTMPNNTNIDPAMLQLAIALQEQMNAMKNPDTNTVPNTNPNTVPSNVPVTPVPPVVQLQNEYVVPLAKPTHKANGFSVFQDGRALDTNFKNTPNTVRITKVYVDPHLLNGYDQWELVLRKVQ